MKSPHKLRKDLQGDKNFELRPHLVQTFSSEEPSDSEIWCDSYCDSNYDLYCEFQI